MYVKYSRKVVHLYETFAEHLRTMVEHLRTMVEHLRIVLETSQNYFWCAAWVVTSFRSFVLVTVALRLWFYFLTKEPKFISFSQEGLEKEEHQGKTSNQRWATNSMKLRLLYISRNMNICEKKIVKLLFNGVAS